MTLIDCALAPDISPELVAQAHAVTPTSYDAVWDELLVQLCQDDIDELGSGLQDPATPAQARANARRLSETDVYVGVGYCLATVRGREFEILPLYPDAETAWEKAEIKHREIDPARIPAGAIVFWTNGGFGHVALSVGGGMCWTTDYRRSGYVDLAPIAALGPWCRGKLVGWAEDLNGVDCWPTPAKPKPKPVFDLPDRIRVVRRALHEALEDNAPAYRVRGLRAWVKRLEARRDSQEKKK